MGLALVSALWARSDLHISLAPYARGQRDALEALRLAEELLRQEPEVAAVMDAVAWSLLRTGIWAGRLDDDAPTSFAHPCARDGLWLSMLPLPTEQDDLYGGQTPWSRCSGASNSPHAGAWRRTPSARGWTRSRGLSTGLEDEPSSRLLPPRSWLAMTFAAESGDAAPHSMRSRLNGAPCRSRATRPPASGSRA